MCAFVHAGSRLGAMTSMRPWREGVATPAPPFSREAQKGWVWIPVWIGLGVAGGVYEDARAGWKLAAAYGAALLLGVAWQWLSRRDLADRLLCIAALSASATVVMALGGADASMIRHDSMRMVLFVPLIAGLVLTEQWMRSRDARRRTARAEAVGAAD